MGCSMKIYFIAMILGLCSVNVFASTAKDWVQKTLPDSLKDPTSSPTDRLEYLKQQEFPEGVTLSEVIDAVLDME
jgi:hypothetical protein